MQHSRIAITMGDPAGVGPEIICKSLAELPTGERATAVVVADRRIMDRAASVVGADLRFEADGDDLAPGAVPIVDVPLVDVDAFRQGEATPVGGEAAYRCIVRAVELAQAGAVGPIVTAPINKAALHAAGHEFDGHTELLAHLTGTRQSFMLLTSERLSVIHVSTHVSLADAVHRATTARNLDTIRAGHRHMQRMGFARPRIAVAGLNPHCGEGGLFGDQDDRRIRPAVEQAQGEGIDVQGPISGDTVFYRAYQGEFDLVVAQYHDQGHIPVKLIAYDTTVNVTVGLPIDRASVDHGTAFDIAWQGRPKHDNMLAAIAYARRLAATPNRGAGPAAGGAGG